MKKWPIVFHRLLAVAPPTCIISHSTSAILASAWLFQQRSWNRICPSSVVRRPCRNYSRSFWQISFKFQLLLALDHIARRFWIFEKKNAFSNFHDFFFAFVDMGPYRSKKFKMPLLPQITSESFQTCSDFSSQWSSQNYCFWIFEILSLQPLITIF